MSSLKRSRPSDRSALKESHKYYAEARLNGGYCMGQTKTNKTIAAVRDHGPSFETAALMGLERKGSGHSRTAAIAILAVAAATSNVSAAELSPLFDLSAGTIYEKSLVQGVSNIPLSLRNVPINPADTYVPTGNQGPIVQTSLKPSDRITIATLDIGGKLSFERKDGNGDWLAVSAGLGLDFNFF